MQKKLTITLAPDVYEGLHRVIGRGNISGFIEDLVRPRVVSLRESDLDEQYRLAAADDATEDAELEWSEALIEDAFDESR